MNRLRYTLLTAMLGIASHAAVSAQDGAIGAEHRYQFSLGQNPSTYQEKLMLEAINSLDPEMRVDIDRPERMMKVLAYRPLDPQEIVNLAALHGMSIQPRRPRIEVTPAINSNQ